MSKILFFAHDPGGANALYPLFAYLGTYELFVYAQGPAADIFNVEVYEGTAEELFYAVKPDLVITGTSAANMLEKKLRQAARLNNIPCISILDYWSNYGVRFSSYSLSEYKYIYSDKNLPYLPDYLIVMDEYAKEQAIKDGIPETIIYPLGNPHFERVRNSKNLDVKNLRNELLQGKEKLVVYASSCTAEDYGKGAERESVQDILSFLPDNYQFLIKMHPRDSKDKYADFSEYVLTKNLNSIETILAADIVLANCSMLLIEGLLLDKKVISYQKNALADKFILSQMGIIPFITEKEQLKNAVFSSQNYVKKYNFKENCIQDIIKFIGETVCQN